MARKTISNFTIASDDEHPLNIEQLTQHCDRYAYIRHDDPGENKPHTHFVGHLGHNDRTTVENIAKWANVASNFVEVVRSQVGILNYLTHKDEPDKITYPESAITANFDVQDFIQKENAKQTFQTLLDKIHSGEVKEYEITQYCDIHTYVKHVNEINAAFAFYAKTTETVDRNLEAWFITGNAGSGKTTLAKYIAQKLGLACYITSSGKNPLDGYQQQPCLIMDDCRPSDFKFNDFLKLIDNNTNCQVGARYHDKFFNNCTIVIVTSCLPLDLWYKNLQENDGEATQQITRRFGHVIEVKNYDPDTGVLKATDNNTDEELQFNIPVKKPTTSRIDLRALADAIIPKG